MADLATTSTAELLGEVIAAVRRNYMGSPPHRPSAVGAAIEACRSAGIDREEIRRAAAKGRILARHDFTRRLEQDARDHRELIFGRRA